MIEQSNGLHFMYDHTGVMGFTYQGKTYFYQKDLQGNIFAIVNAAGVAVAFYHYDAWGNHKVYDGDYITEMTSPTFIGNLNPFRYRGYYYDSETGLYYLKSRYYDPEVGRFISADTVNYAEPSKFDGLNLYAYCNNNPVMFVDPEGHFLCAIISGLFGTLWSALDAIATGKNVAKAVVVGATSGFLSGFAVDIGAAIVAANVFSCGTATIALGVAVACFAIGVGTEIANQMYVQDIPFSEVDWGQVAFCGVVNAASSLISFGFARLSGAYENVVGNVWQRLLSTLKPTADNIGEGLASGLLSGGVSSFGMIAGALYQALKELFK